METFRYEVEGRKATLHPAETAGAPLVVLNEYVGDGTSVVRGLRALGAPDANLLCVGGLDWDNDMSPWPCPPLSPRDTPCAGGADAYLALLESRILPQAEARLESPPAFVAIAGYSLAGLFAIYSLYRTGRFSHAASASGSMWFPRFREYALSREMERRPKKLYLSLGDTESKVRHPLLRTVQENTEALVAHWRSTGIDTDWELNSGNHFKDAALRTAKAVAALLRHPA